MRRSRLAAGRAGHVRKRGQPCGRQRNVESPRGPHLMVSTSMVYGCIIDVFNTEDISAECSGEKPPSRPRIPCVCGLEVGVGGGLGCWEYVSRSLFRALRERRVTLERMENVIVGLTGPFCCFVALPRKARYFRKGGQLGRTAALSRTYFWSVSPTINYPWHTCVKTCSCYTCNCCFRAG